MEPAASIAPPSYITAMRNGRKWPPNRPDEVTESMLEAWRQQDPTINSIARRPLPKDFIRAFAILGWRESSWYYRASSRVISRWVNEAGREAVLAERALMRRSRARFKLKSLMAAYCHGEPREPEWLVEQARQSG